MSDARQYALPTQMVGPGQVSIRLRPIPSSKPQAAAAASSASAFRPSPAATALLNAARSAENAVASLSSPPPHIPNIEMLTAGILDPLSVVNSAANPVVSATRFRPVPREDVMICHSDKVRTPILPQEFPGFIPPNAPTKLKLLGILEPEGLGKADKTSSHDIILYRWVNDEIRRLEADEGSQAAAAGGAAAGVDRDSSGVKQQFLELKPVPAHKDVYPVSVSLHIKPNEQAQLISRLHADGHRNSVWPNVIQYYQPFKLYRNNAFAHYEVKVLQSSLDRYFPVGLFGTCANGLSLVLLALAKVPKSAKSQKKTAEGSSSSSSAAAAADAAADDDASNGTDKIKGLLYHYITLICLQYWTLVHERWMELNPIAKDVTQYLPEYMFIFHHTTDWTQSFKDTKRDRKGEKKKKKSKKSTDKTVPPAQQEELPEEITDNDSLREAAMVIAFVPFLEAVFDYVIGRMDELEDSEDENDSAIAAACKKLSLSRSAVRKRSANISTNHTQYFTCSRMKMHIVKELVQTINDGVHSNTTGQSLGFLETKWFAKNKNQLKMHIPKAANEAATAGVNRYNNPYFWSHLTFLPTQGIVVQEATLRCGESPEANPMHQACALRRLLFVAHNSESATIMSSLLRVGVCTFEFSHTPERVTLSSKEFIEQFVQTKKFKSMAMLHEARVEQQMYLPAVAKPAALRYCVHFDDEIGRAYIPSLSRDLASFPVSDEQDILSMSRSYFLACSTSTNIVSSEAVLLQTGVLKNNPANLCTRFANSRLTHKAFPVLKDLGGLSHGFTKLCPDNSLCNLVYIDGSLKLTEAERRQLRLIAKSEGVFSGLHMWKLLLKITSSDSEAVSSYLFHAHQSEQRRIKSERVKMEEGVDGPVVHPAAAPAAAAAASSSEYDRDWVLDRLVDLQSEWERASQISVRQFRRVWGATVPASPSNKRKSHSEQDSDHDFVPNPYWPAQECFLAQLRENWNYCDRPTVTANALSKLIGELMAVDLEKFTITLFAANATDGGVRLDREKLKMLLSGAVISQLGRTGPTPIHSLVSIAEDSSVALTEHEIMFHGDERSVLGKRFAEFFSTSRYATSSCNIEVAFFMWYYFTAVIRPFVDNLPRLFPISSVIKHQPVSTMLPPKTWLQALVPSDSTPHLTSLMFKFSADLCKSDIHRELETSINRGTKISTQAQAMLRAMQTVIDALDDAMHKKDSKLNVVNSFAAELLSSLKPPASASAASSRQPFAALARPAAAAGVTRMQALQDQAFHVIIQQLKVFPLIPLPTVTKLYEDLSALIDIEQDPIDFIVSIFCKVQGALLATPLLQPLSKKFAESLSAWQKDNSPSQLLRTCALKFNKIVDRR